MIPVLFLDRDGIVNIDKGYISNIKDFEFTQEIFKICRLFQANNYKIVIVTNQSGIGRGKIQVHEFHKMTIWMLQKFEEQNIRIELVLASALNPEISNPSAYESLRRKPNPGLFHDAREIISIDIEKSVMIGDNLTDGDAAAAAGLSQIFIVNEKHVSNQVFRCFNSLLDLSKQVIDIMGFKKI
jgi:D-glycero-D-manno-heptose 1,7-bisphosphate phosphatase